MILFFRLCWTFLIFLYGSMAWLSLSPLIVFFAAVNCIIYFGTLSRALLCPFFSEGMSKCLSPSPSLTHFTWLTAQSEWLAGALSCTCGALQQPCWCPLVRNSAPCKRQLVDCSYPFFFLSLSLFPSTCSPQLFSFVALHHLQVCRRKGYNSPSLSDHFSWPSIARGCNTVVVSQATESPLSYLLPVLSHLLLSSIHAPHTSKTGVSTFCINLMLLPLFLQLCWMYWCAATRSAVVPRLGEGAAGVWAAGGH